MLFWRWKLRRPQRMQSVCVLFRRLPKLPVPFPCEPQQQHRVSGRKDGGVGGGGGSSGEHVPFPSLLRSARVRGGGAAWSGWDLGEVAAWGRRGVKP